MQQTKRQCFCIRGLGEMEELINLSDTVEDCNELRGVVGKQRRCWYGEGGCSEHIGDDSEAYQ